MSDFNITLFEACELLNRSKKSISRYVRRSLLHPQEIKSKQGTLEYRFSKADLEAFKAQETEETGQGRQDRAGQTGHFKVSFIENKEDLDETRQDTGDKTGQDRTPEKRHKKEKEAENKGQTDQTGQDRADGTGQGNEVIKLLKETTGFLREQLHTKDEQIKSLGGKIDGLIERGRETNILMGRLQERVLQLEAPREQEVEAEVVSVDKVAKTSKNYQKRAGGHKATQNRTEGQKEAEQTGQDKPKQEKMGFWKRVFNEEL